MPSLDTHLLMTADAVGGVWTYAVDLAQGLQAHGVQVLLAVNGPAPEPDAQAAAQRAGVEAVVTGLPLDWTAQSADEVRAAGAALAQLAARRGVDLVQVNAPAYAAAVAFPVPVVGVQHSCTATWWRAVRGAQPWPADFDWRFDLACEGLLACDRTVAPSAAFADAVRRAYDLPVAPACVWNGRAPAAAASAADGGYVFTSGRLWDESKGMAVLDAAAASLGAPVLAAGPLAAPHGGRAHLPHMRTPGRLDGPALTIALAGATVFCSPSLYEPFGLSVLEAAQAARPLVLSDIPTFRELWGGAAVFTPPGDAQVLAHALNALLADAPRRAALGAAALARSRRYTAQAMAAGMAAIYAQLL